MIHGKKEKNFVSNGNSRNYSLDNPQSKRKGFPEGFGSRYGFEDKVDPEQARGLFQWWMNCKLLV